MFEFVTACRIEELPPGAARPLVVRIAPAGEPPRKLELAVYNIGGTLYASDGICPHRRSQLCEGFQHPGKIECSEHGWVFDLTTGAYEVNPEVQIRIYPVRVVDGEVQVGVPVT